MSRVSFDIYKEGVPPGTYQGDLLGSLCRSKGLPFPALLYRESGKGVEGRTTKRLGRWCQMENDVCCIWHVVRRSRVIWIVGIGPAGPVPGRVFIPIDVDGQGKDGQLADHDVLDASDSLLLRVDIAG